MNKFMTRNRFKVIMSALKHTNKEPPTMFVDRFHDVYQMIYAVNEHYGSEYCPSWFSCIDKLMSG